MKRIKGILQDIADDTNSQVILFTATHDLEKGDERKFEEELLKKIHANKDTTIIISGPGGNTYAALSIAMLLRMRLMKSEIDCIVSKYASSALGFIALLSNRITLSEGSCLSQVDMILEKGERAIDLMRTGRTKEEKERGKYYWTYLVRVMGEIRQLSPIFKKKLPKRIKDRQTRIGDFITIFTRKKTHDVLVTYRMMEKLEMNVRILDSQDSIRRKTLDVSVLAEEYLQHTNQRLFIQIVHPS